MASLGHDVPSPFPFATPHGTITNERCDCTHKRTDHLDTVSFGHGRCAVDDCACQKFSWASCIFSEIGR